MAHDKWSAVGVGCMRVLRCLLCSLHESIVRLARVAVFRSLSYNLPRCRFGHKVLCLLAVLSAVFVSAHGPLCVAITVRTPPVSSLFLFHQTRPLVLGEMTMSVFNAIASHLACGSRRSGGNEQSRQPSPSV